MKLISWNVNGLRAIIKKGLEDFLAEENPDIFCMQEIKARPDQVDLNFDEYHTFWNPAEKAGYSGTAVFSKVPPISVESELTDTALRGEGRVQTLEFAQCFLVNVYTPNSQRELARLAYRTKQWDKGFLEHLIALEKQKPVIFCGDLNVAHQEIDLANPKTNRKNAGFTDDERQSFSNIIDHGFVDTFRAFNQEPHQYTWWSYRAGARERNVGWRIDYFCTSQKLKESLINSEILPQVMGSDHCPIRLSIDRTLF